MIVSGVVVPAAVCARYGPLLDLLARAHARQNGMQVDGDLDGLLRELVSVGLAHRQRVGSAEDRPADPPPQVWKRCEECDRSTDKLRRGLCNACRMRRARRGHSGNLTGVTEIEEMSA